MIVPSSPTHVVPNVAQIAREMTSKSQIGIVIDKAKALPLHQLFLLGLRNIQNLPMLAKKDFASGIALLCELEILSSKKKTQWTLHNQMCDMALALHNTRLISNFFALAKAYDFTPVLMTYNPERFINFLSSMQGLPKNLVIACPKTSAKFDTFAKSTQLRIQYI